MVASRRGESTSSEIANATAHSPAFPCSSIACRASLIPSRAVSIQCPSCPRSSTSGADRIDQVSVEIT